MMTHLDDAGLFLMGSVGAKACGYPLLAGAFLCVAVVLFVLSIWSDGDGR